VLVTAPLPRRNLTCRAVARDSSNTERRTADATVARQGHRGAEQGRALPIRVGNGKQREEKSSFRCGFVQQRADIRGVYMIGIEFGPPKSLGLKTAWALMHKMDKSLFPQACARANWEGQRLLLAAPWLGAWFASATSHLLQFFGIPSTMHSDL
jgi:hypothetical protein